MNTEKPIRDGCVRLSFREALEMVTERVDRNDLRDEHGQVDPICDDLLRILAEMYIFAPDTAIRINGERMPASVVREVFDLLTADHILMVADNFSRITEPLRMKKAYLRTALYNSVYELDAHLENLYNVQFGGVKG